MHSDMHSEYALHALRAPFVAYDLRSAFLLSAYHRTPLPHWSGPFKELATPLAIIRCSDRGIQIGSADTATTWLCDGCRMAIRRLLSCRAATSLGALPSCCLPLFGRTHRRATLLLLFSRLRCKLPLDAAATVRQRQIWQLWRQGWQLGRALKPCANRVRRSDDAAALLRAHRSSTAVTRMANEAFRRSSRNAPHALLPERLFPGLGWWVQRHGPWERR